MSVWRNHNQYSKVPSAPLVCLRIRQKRDPHIPSDYETEAASALKHRKKRNQRLYIDLLGGRRLEKVKRRTSKEGISPAPSPPSSL